MSKLAHSCDETMAIIEQQSTGDLMRQTSNEYLSWMLWSDAKDMLHEILKMTQAERLEVLNHIKLAHEVLGLAIKECE